ncbi:hypothetical protein OG239_42285 (plasmid) [Streptomyces sp. NBC_00868]|uniref:hypothetical protein n=1 Tax=Streptomyces sp. NBC_00868 TaxID=2903683 RepID=UPI003864532E|nr:hypothetical protein OG239_42285 [Streptomyces sp. NBC_00868]
MESVLRVKYSVWWEGAWRPQPWMTIASTTANSNSNKYESRVKDVRFAICDYVPGGSYTACGYVS